MVPCVARLVFLMHVAVTAVTLGQGTVRGVGCVCEDSDGRESEWAARELKSGTRRRSWT
jgi:hypothetical protein